MVSFSLGLGLSVQSLLDLTLAGLSLMIGLAIFSFIALILCSASFVNNAKDVA